ncbi:MAG: POT family MFS transporter [Verrucomicrobia bacterium]|nr:POT family MFS transporter [Verrucomicrobiota bacterium]
MNEHTPAVEPRFPPQIKYIVGNEACERFSYYGMRNILVVFMTQYLVSRSGALDVMTEEQAKFWYHLFVSAVYFLPLLGAVLADAFWGKYKTILWLSIVYCFGHLALALDDTRLGLAVGLTLIALGSGGIKPCVSANVGDQFGPHNQQLLPKVFGWFYFSINFGSFFSTLLTPVLMDKVGPWLAFGVPGILMGLATLVFWMGRHQYVRVPPGGMAFVRETFSREGLGSLLGLAPIYLVVAMFWALWDQTGSAWVLQAEAMNRVLDLKVVRFELLASQVQAVNPILVMLLIPLFSYVVYPAVSRVFPLTPLRRIGVGLFLTVPSFLITAWVESMIAAGERPTIAWQLAAFVLITAAEVMVSITCLEFSYTQAPPRMKSLVMAAYLLSVSLGNAFTSAINFFIQNPDGTSKLSGVAYFNLFSGLMFVTAVIFVFIALRYRERNYVAGMAAS